MDSNGTSRISVNTTTTTTSPKGGKGSIGSTQKGAGTGQCLCSPTTHQGSFRCRFHRSTSSSPPPPPWFKRSKSMPPNRTVTTSLSPKSVDSSSAITNM